MDDVKREDSSNVVYLNPPRPIRTIGYVQVSEAVDGKTISVIRDDGSVTPVLGISGNLPALAVGDWVKVVVSRLGAQIKKRIEIDWVYTVGRHGPDPGRWYESFSSPIKLSGRMDPARRRREVQTSERGCIETQRSGWLPNLHYKLDGLARGP